MTQELATRRGELAFLELLVANAAPGEFEELLLRARIDGTAPHVLTELKQAKEMALRIGERLRRLDRRKNELATLMDTARDLGERRSLDALLTTIVRRARLLLHVDMTCISLYEDSGYVVFRASDGAISAAMTEEIRVRHGVCLGSEAARTRAPVWTPDYLRDDRIPHTDSIDNLVREEGLSALLAVPMRRGDEVIGVLYCGDRGVRSFTADETALMVSLADYAAIAIERTRALDDVRSKMAGLTAAHDRLHARIQAEEQAGAAGRTMVELVLAGGDAEALAQATVEALGGYVLIRDENDLTVAEAGEPAGADEELGRAVFEARAENKVVRAEGVSVVPVRAGEEDLGALIHRSRDEPAEPDLRVLQHAVRAAAMLALLNRSTTATDRQVRDEALDELLSAANRGGRRQRQWVQRLGVDLGRPHLLVVARAEGGQRGRSATWASTFVSLRDGAKTVRDGYLVLLLPGEDAGAAAREVMRDLGRTLNSPVTAAGAAVQGEPDALSRAFQEAVRCLEALTALGRHGTAATVEELGFVGMLLGDSRDANGFIEATIGSVIAYDAERSTDLRNTLEAYFAAGGSPTYAAEALQVHPNTVVRRLERISHLLGPDWQQSGPALEIQLALRLLRVRNSLREGRPATEEDGD